MNTEFSPEIDKIASALIDFQAECPEIKKTKSGQHGMYADLASIIALIRPILQKHKLGFSQFPDGKNGLTTILLHSSGQWMRSYYEMEAVPVKIDSKTNEKAVTPQSLGGVITYQRRYALGAALGFAAEEDTDARLKREKLADKPKKSIKDLLNKQQSTTEAATTEEPEGVSTVGVTAIAVDGPCTADDCLTVKQMVADWDAVKPGVSVEFATRMAATGRKLAQFSIREVEALKQAIQLKAMESFFDHQLQKKS